MAEERIPALRAISPIFISESEKFLLDLKCALTISILPDGIQALWTRRKYGESVVQTIATHSQNGRRDCFLKLVDSHRRTHYRSPWIVEVHALLSSRGSLCLGSCR